MAAQLEIPARAVVQQSSDGELNLFLLTDPLATIDDLLISSGPWADHEVYTENIVMRISPSLMALINEREFRSTSNVGEHENTTTLTEEQVQNTGHAIERHDRSKLDA